MSKSIRSKVIGFIALAILPSLITAYDCSRITRGECTQGKGTDPLVDFSTCILKRYSVSVFVQCASQPNPPVIIAPAAPGTDNNSKAITIIDILVKAASTPAGSVCGFSTNILRTAKAHGSTPFVKYMCDKYHVIDSGSDSNHLGICCLNVALGIQAKEHSIQSVCEGHFDDLTNAPKLGNSCPGSEDLANTDDTANDGNSASASASASASSAANTSVPQPTTRPSNSNAPLTVNSTSPGGQAMQTGASSAGSTKMPAAAKTTSASGTSASPLAQPSNGAIGRQGSLFGSLGGLGIAVLPILAAF